MTSVGQYDVTPYCSRPFDTFSTPATTSAVLWAKSTPKPPKSGLELEKFESERKLFITIYLNVDESWRNDGSFAVNLLIGNDFLIEKYWLWIDNFPVADPQVLHDQLMVPDQTAIHELNGSHGCAY